jgi:hypothetical protein
MGKNGYSKWVAAESSKLPPRNVFGWKHTLHTFKRVTCTLMDA